MKPFIEVIKTNIRGIKCDNPKCTYHEDISIADYSQWIGVPCPLCSSNLLTIADYNAMTIMENKILKINKFVNKWIPYFILKHLIIAEKPKHFSVEMNGTGQIKIKK